MILYTRKRLFPHYYRFIMPGLPKFTPPFRICILLIIGKVMTHLYIIVGKQQHNDWELLSEHDCAMLCNVLDRQCCAMYTVQCETVPSGKAVRRRCSTRQVTVKINLGFHLRPSSHFICILIKFNHIVGLEYFTFPYVFY